MKAKNIIFVVCSVILHMTLSIINLIATFNKSLDVPNFIISLFFIFFWVAMLIFTFKSKGIMIYSLILWTITSISSLTALISAVNDINIGFFIVPTTTILSPFVGLKGVIDSPIVVFSLLFAFSVICVIVSIVSLIVNRNMVVKKDINNLNDPNNLNNPNVYLDSNNYNNYKEYK